MSVVSPEAGGDERRSPRKEVATSFRSEAAPAVAVVPQGWLAAASRKRRHFFAPARRPAQSMTQPGISALQFRLAGRPCAYSKSTSFIVGAKKLLAFSDQKRPPNCAHTPGAVSTHVLLCAILAHPVGNASVRIVDTAKSCPPKIRAAPTKPTAVGLRFCNGKETGARSWATAASSHHFRETILNPNG